MKKIYLGVWLLCFILAYGCNDFLEESSQDEIHPSSVEDMEQITQGSCYFNPDAHGAGGVNFYHITDIFTDDIQCYGVGTTNNQTEYESKDAMFRWSSYMFWNDDRGDGDKPAFYQYPYQGIGSCNVVLDFLDQMEGDEDQREHLRGEVLALRAYYYFHLVNFFGLPYNSTIGSPEENLGVPLQLTSSVVENPSPRNTVQEVYEQIIGDMTRGYQLMVEHPRQGDINRIGPVAVAAMLSRVYLYMEDWDQTIAYADTVLRQKSALLDLNDVTLPDLTSSTNVPVTVFDPSGSDEIIWARQYGATVYSPSNSGDVVMPWATSEDLCESLFQGYTATNVATTPGGSTTDLRAYFFFRWTRMNDGTYYIMYPDKPMDSQRTVNGRTQGIRTAEIYLNRAEAYIRKAMEEGNESYLQNALNDLNFLREHRYMNYTPLEMQSAEELLDVCLSERRKELAGEMNHRWFDIRRCHLTYDHTTFAHIGEEETVTLNENLYALPIPQAAMNKNNQLVQNR